MPQISYTNHTLSYTKPPFLAYSSCFTSHDRTIFVHHSLPRIQLSGATAPVQGFLRRCSIDARAVGNGFSGGGQRVNTRCSSIAQTAGPNLGNREEELSPHVSSILECFSYMPRLRSMYDLCRIHVGYLFHHTSPNSA